MPALDQFEKPLLPRSSREPLCPPIVRARFEKFRGHRHCSPARFLRSARNRFHHSAISAAADDESLLGERRAERARLGVMRIACAGRELPKTVTIFACRFIFFLRAAPVPAFPPSRRNRVDRGGRARAAARIVVLENRKHEIRRAAWSRNRKARARVPSRPSSLRSSPTPQCSSCAFRACRPRPPLAASKKNLCPMAASRHNAAASRSRAGSPDLTAPAPSRRQITSPSATPAAFKNSRYFSPAAVEPTPILFAPHRAQQQLRMQILAHLICDADDFRRGCEMCSASIACSQVPRSASRSESPARPLECFPAAARAARGPRP